MKINFQQNEVIKDIKNNNNSSYDNILELKNVIIQIVLEAIKII